MRYIVATDGSDASRLAARIFARHICPRPEDEVFLVYVFPLLSDWEHYADVVSLPHHPSDDRVTRVAKPILAETREVLGELESRIEEAILLGDPAKEIVELATTLRVDLVVVGTHGRSVRTDLYLGSVSSAVTRLAPCSVLVVR
jgi:nucleotide-binding universal stress UspA family protein